jgi:uncharacterized protein YndB with AHSA1/START domain
MQRTIRLERLIPYAPERVWHALTDCDTLGRWFMPTTTFAPRLGHAFTFQMKPQRGWDGTTYCQITELEPLRRIAYTYQGSATGEKTLACANVDSEMAKSAAKGIFTELDTVLSFTLTPEVTCGGIDQTRLLLEHTGFKGAKLMIVSLVLGYGWRTSVLPRLDTELARMSTASEGASAVANS